MGNLVQRLESEPMMIGQAVKYIKPRIGKYHVVWLFNCAVEEHVRDMISSDSDACYFDDNHPVFNIDMGNQLASAARIEPKDYANQKRKRPLQIKSFRLAYDLEKRNLLLCRGKHGFSPSEEGDMECSIISLLFEYRGKTVYSIARFLDPGSSPEQKDAVSPLRDFEIGKLHIQRALGRYVDYWGIVNEDFAQSLPEGEIERFTRKGYRLVVLPITMEDAKIFEGCVRGEVKKMKQKRRKTTKVITSETAAQYSQGRGPFS